MNYRCKRHPQNQVTHFCNNIECEYFLTFRCIKCIQQACSSSYHLLSVEELQSYIAQFQLPQLQYNQWDYCMQQMNKIKSTLNDLLANILSEYKINHEAIIQYIQDRSQQQQEELIQQFNFQQEIINEKYESYQDLYNNKIQKYKQQVQDVQQQLQNSPKEGEDIEDYIQQLSIQSIYQEYNHIFKIQPELDLLIQENSLQITKEQQTQQMLNDNQYEKFRNQIESNIEGSLNIIWGKFFQLTNNISILNNNRSSSIAESETLSQMVRKSRTYTQSVMEEIDNIISLSEDVQDEQLQLSRPSYGYSGQNLQQQIHLELQLHNHKLNIEPQSNVTPFCLVAIKNYNLILTGGDSNELYIWSQKNDQKVWKMESKLQITKEPQQIQAMDIVYNPFVNESRCSRQSFATLRVLLNPIIAVGVGNNIVLIQLDMLTNQATIQARYQLKDEKDQQINCIMQCQSMGTYNYFIVGMGKGSMLVFNYIISIDNTFSLRLDYVIRQHQEQITCMEPISDQYFAVSSNDRSVSLWNWYNNKPKLLNIKMNRFWEDITCIRQISPCTFITCDVSFNIIIWHLESETQVKVIQSQMNKQQIQIHEAIVINNPQNKNDFCLFMLVKMVNSKLNPFRIMILDRQLKVILQDDSLNKFQFESTISIQKKKKSQQHFITNHKMRIIKDQLQNKMFSSFSDLKSSKLDRQLSQGESIQLNCSKLLNIVIVSNGIDGRHFIEYSLKIGE